MNLTRDRDAVNIDYMRFLQGAECLFAVFSRIFLYILKVKAPIVAYIYVQY